jgi:hypothetical protein
MGGSNSKEILLNAIRGDKQEEIKKLLEKDPSLKEDFVNRSADQTALSMAAYLGSEVGVKVLLDVIYFLFFSLGLI